MLDEALAEFHNYKEVFLNSNATDSLDLPKLHSLVHYSDSIRLFGATDGYNTEQTERLHIDLAKHAYDASHHRESEVMPFMCTWLERKEKIFRFATYLSSLSGERFSSLKRPVKDRERPAVAFTSAPTERARTVAQITTNHLATQFSNRVIDFIKQYVKIEWAKQNGRTPVPSYEIPSLQLLGFNVWHRVRFNTPDTQTLEAPATVDIAHAAPARTSYTRRIKSLPARFDPVQVELDGDGVAGEGGMTGIRIAQLRVLFTLPESLQMSIFDRLKLPRPGHLAYLDWFAKIGSPDSDTRMFTVRRSFRTGSNSHLRQAAVIEAIDLRRTCHLVAKLSGHAPEIPLYLNVHNLYERWNEFWVNNYVDKAAYRTIYE